MAWDLATFQLKFPEFSDLEQDAYDLCTSVAELYVNEAVWGVKYDSGVAYLTAHLIALAQRGSAEAAGPVIMEKVGDLQRRFADQSGDETLGGLGKTNYGVIFLAFRATVSPLPMVIT